MTRRLAWILLSAIAAPVLAGGTSHWTHTSEADFRKGRLQNVVVTNLGDLKLSRAVKTLLEQDPRVSAVYALAEGKDGTIYAGTGPQGIVLQVKADKPTTLATLEDENIFSLLIDRQGMLLVGTGGDKGRILRLDPAKADQKPQEVFSAEGVQYIWKIVQVADGTLYAATGPNGQVFQINADGSSSTLFDADENNILSLIDDGKDNLVAGTDPNGLVYRINRKSREATVLFDAPEAEISSLAMDARGNIYAGTGQAGDLDEKGDQGEGAAEKTGRPDGGESVTPLPSPAPKDPKPPELPRNPGEHPIPRSSTSFIFLSDMGGGSAAADDPAMPTPAPGQPRRQPMGGIMLPVGGRVATPSGAARPQAVEGNAIYRIDPEGFVQEVFRENVLVLSMVEREGNLIVGTGSDGQVFQVNPAAGETSVLAKVDPKQVMSLLIAGDGRIILGMANVGGLAAMSSGFAAEGTYTSAVLDARQIARFGKMRLSGSLPPGTSLSVSTRSGNLQEPKDSGWNSWSDPLPAAAYVQIPSTPARFLQYRLTLRSQDGTASPLVDEVDVAHQVPNMAPQVSAIKIMASPENEAPRPNLQTGMSQGVGKATQPRTTGRQRIVTWEAADPNDDELVYTLEYRSGPKSPWIVLQDKLKEPQYQWDTRGVSDGRYELRVTASDARANEPGTGRTGTRTSDAVVVDNTPPMLGDLKAEPIAGGVRISAKIVDRTSGVASVEYAINSRDDWQAVGASDKIFDSPEEGVDFEIRNLAPGAYQIALRAVDDHGNESYQTLHVTVP